MAGQPGQHTGRRPHAAHHRGGPGPGCHGAVSTASVQPPVRAGRELAGARHAVHLRHPMVRLATLGTPGALADARHCACKCTGSVSQWPVCLQLGRTWLSSLTRCHLSHVCGRYEAVTLHKVEVLQGVLGMGHSALWMDTDIVHMGRCFQACLHGLEHGCCLARPTSCQLHQLLSRRAAVPHACCMLQQQQCHTCGTLQSACQPSAESSRGMYVLSSACVCVARCPT